MSDPTKLSRRYLTLVVAMISLIALTAVAFLLPVPYITQRPGPVFDTLGKPFDDQPLLTFGGDVKTYKTTGSLNFTTVSVTRADAHVTLADAIRGYFDPNVAVVPKSLVYPDHETAKQSKAESAAQLDSSKDYSRVAALRALGYEVTERPEVAQVIKGGASVGKLKTGDLIDKINGEAVADQKAAVEAVGKVKPGDTVTVTVTRDGKSRDVEIVTRPDATDPKIPRIGISIGTKFILPVQVDNNVGSQIGGPSAGTMFALAIYDKLTPGELTGGKTIAGTGTISPDGVVGPIGGVRQKMAGAQEAGATIFLVPAANCAEATNGSDDGLKLVKITKLDDAISSLEALAKNPKAKVPTCS